MNTPPSTYVKDVLGELGQKDFDDLRTRMFRRRDTASLSKLLVALFVTHVVNTERVVLAATPLDFGNMLGPFLGELLLSGGTAPVRLPCAQ
jgi:hypothetical protein